MSARGRFLSRLVTVVIAVAGFATVGALSAAANSSTVQYVALGDSYAAGQGAGPYLNSCRQTAESYPELLDSEKRIHLRANEACSGATTSEVANTQLSALNRGTRLVTLTVGAADLDLSGVATLCTAPGMLVQCLAEIREVRQERLPMLGDDLTDLFAMVADAAPRARIVVTGYPHLIEPNAPVDSRIIFGINTATDELNAAISEAVTAQDADVNFDFVDVTGRFARHGTGAEPQPLLINPPGVPDAFHPNADGYDAYAKAISVALQMGG
jgi:lysophospholipase L1-like esterase